MKRYGRPKVIVTDRLRSYRAAMKVIGNAERLETGRWLNNTDGRYRFDGIRSFFIPKPSSGATGSPATLVFFLIANL